jgi:DNA gyrase/topoisomerase IV subunit A
MNRTKEQDFLIQNVISQIATYIAEDMNIRAEQALEIFFSTDISKKIEEIETEYYLESPSYIYEILKEELSNGEGDYTAERREKIDNINRKDFQAFLQERGEMK